MNINGRERLWHEQDYEQKGFWVPESVLKTPQPRWGWDLPFRFPRIARSSQPWAEGHNPVGIEETPRLNVTRPSSHSNFAGTFEFAGSAVPAVRSQCRTCSFL